MLSVTITEYIAKEPTRNLEFCKFKAPLTRGPPPAPQVLPVFAYAIDSIVRTVGSSITFDLMATLIDLNFQIDLSNNLFPVTRSLNERAGWLSFVSVCPTYNHFKNFFNAYLSVTQLCHPSKYRQ